MPSQVKPHPYLGGSGLLFATPFKVSGPRYPVQLEDVKRFGKTRRFGDHRQWNIGELVTGEIVHFLHKDQSPDMLKVLRKRLKGVWADCDRLTGEGFAWESPDDACSPNLLCGECGQHKLASVHTQPAPKENPEWLKIGERYTRQLGKEFRQQRGLTPDTPLQLYSRADERWVIVELTGADVWIHDIGSDDDEWFFVSNEGLVCRWKFSPEITAMEESNEWSKGE